MKTLLPALILLSTFSLSPAFAQDEERADDTLPWYQIELIVFENRSHQSAVDPERWPRDIFLAYPMHSRQLLTLEEFKAHDEKRKQAEIEAHLASDPTLDRAALNQALVDAEAFPEEQPFISLDESVFQLKREKNAIDRERNMRVLAHKVWRQPVGNRGQATPVVITGGNQYDEHFELEGSVRVSVSRYLHVDANLWLSSFVANTGDNADWWPQAPQRPAKFSKTEEENALDTIQDDASMNTTVAPWMQSQSASMQFGLNARTDSGLTTERTRNYTVSELVKLEQSRRMRSAELHYIDHPRIGILVRIDSYNIYNDKESDEEDREKQ